MFSIISASSGGVFGVLPDQYSRVLQLMKAKGLFDSYKHSCEMQSDGTGYKCEDRLDAILVWYYADNKETKINAITIGCLPDNTDRAAAIAATAALSLNAKFQSLPNESPIGTKTFRSLHDEIQAKLESVFVSGGSDLQLTKDAMLMFMANNNKDMTIVRVVPLEKH